MARVPLNIDLTDNAGNVVAGATATVKTTTGANAILYTARTGPTTIANPLVTDANGRGQCWVDRGLYQIVYGGGIVRAPDWWAAGAADDREIDANWLGVRRTLSATAPAAPSDGDLWDFVADATNGVIWTFRYRAASASAYKWEYVGGNPLRVNVDTAESTASAVLVDLTTVGPTVTIPLSGEYRRWTRFLAQGSALGSVISGYTLNGGAVTDFPAGAARVIDANSQIFHNPEMFIAHAAGDVIRMKYRQFGGITATFSFRQLAYLPYRVQ